MADIKELFKTPREAKKIVDCSTIDNDTWLKYRRGGIGGSDSASILGISHWRTQLQLYYDKIGEPTSEEITDQRQYIFDFGHAMEEFVALYFEKVFEEKFKDSFELKFSLHYGEDLRIEKCHVYRDTWMYESPEHPFMRADLDFKVDLTFSNGKTTTGIFECKTTSPFTIKDTWEKEPPEYYVCQTRHYMAVMDVPFTIIACAADNNSNNYFAHIIFRDETEEKKLINAEEEFWWAVNNKIPPYEMGVNNKQSMLEHLPTSSINDAERDNGAFVKSKLSEIEAFNQNIAGLKASIRELEKQKEILESDLLTYMSSNDKLSLVTTIGDYDYSSQVTESSRKSMNYTKIFKEINQKYPNIADEINTIKESHTSRKVTKKLTIKKSLAFKNKKSA